MKTIDYAALFDHSLRLFFKEALRLCLREPAMALHLRRLIRSQNAAARRRRQWAERGVQVPAFAIASVTRGCNLHCAGCYARAQRPSDELEMSAEKLHSVIAEAYDLGIGIMLLAGGEPLTRPELLEVTAAFPEMLFALFTNGLLLDRERIAALARQRHVVPVVSLEGLAGETDARRGGGVHACVQGAMEAMQAEKIFFGASLTVTTRNLDLVTDEGFVRGLLEQGCRLFFFVDYVPVQPGSETLALGEAERAVEMERVAALRRRLPGLFVAFPGDEEQYGGCLAAGRGFVHISPEGRVEPCPFSPHSDSSLQRGSLRTALDSPLLRAIREAEGELRETRGGCALWERREWVESLVQGAPAEA